MFLILVVLELGSYPLNKKKMVNLIKKKTTINGRKYCYCKYNQNIFVSKIRCKIKITNISKHGNYFITMADFK